MHAAGGTTEGGSRLGAGVRKRVREGRGDGGGSGGKRPCGLAGTYALRMALTIGASLLGSWCSTVAPADSFACLAAPP